MQTEHEIKILDINVNEIRSKLDKIGAVFVAEKNMRRYVYDIKNNTDGKESWLRLRDTGEKITLTIKEIHTDDIDGTKELEVDVGEFDKTNIILKKIGFIPKAYQENKRLSYRLNNNKVKIEIDFWPKIPPYIEIEADSNEQIKHTVKLLGFKMSDTTSIGVRKVFLKYGFDIDSFKELRF